MSDSGIATTLKQLQTLHQATYPLYNLSITYNNDCTRAIVKVVNTTKVAGVLLTREEALNLLYKDNAWSDSTKTLTQRQSIVDKELQIKGILNEKV